MKLKYFVRSLLHKGKKGIYENLMDASEAINGVCIASTRIKTHKEIPSQEFPASRIAGTGRSMIAFCTCVREQKISPADVLVFWMK